MASAACWDTQGGESCDTHVTNKHALVYTVVGHVVSGLIVNDRLTVCISA